MRSGLIKLTEGEQDGGRYFDTRSRAFETFFFVSVWVRLHHANALLCLCVSFFSIPFFFLCVLFFSLSLSRFPSLLKVSVCKSVRTCLSLFVALPPQAHAPVAWLNHSTENEYNLGATEQRIRYTK